MIFANTLAHARRPQKKRAGLNWCCRVEVLLPLRKYKVLRIARFHVQRLYIILQNEAFQLLGKSGPRNDNSMTCQKCAIQVLGKLGLDNQTYTISGPPRASVWMPSDTSFTPFSTCFGPGFTALRNLHASINQCCPSCGVWWVTERRPINMTILKIVTRFDSLRMLYSVGGRKMALLEGRQPGPAKVRCGLISPRRTFVDFPRNLMQVCRFVMWICKSAMWIH